MKKNLTILVTVISLGVFIYAAYGIVETGMGYFQNRQTVNEVQNTFYSTASAKQKEPMPVQSHTIRPQFQNLYEQNSDLVGWIKIEDTQIDYSIVQADNNYDYLTQNFYKEDNIAGSIFMDYRNDIESLDPNTIIYGHRMNDGSMFEDLINFKDKDFFETHQTFEFNTLYESYEAEIFSVYITTTDFNYIQTDFANDKEYNQLLTSFRNESLYETDVEVSTDDQILTLSTCDYDLDKHEGRMVVQAKLVKKTEGQ